MCTGYKWDQWRASVNTAMMLRVPQKYGNFLTNWAAISFLRRTLLHGISYVFNIRKCIICFASLNDTVLFKSCLHNDLLIYYKCFNKQRYLIYWITVPQHEQDKLFLALPRNIYKLWIQRVSQAKKISTFLSSQSHVCLTAQIVTTKERKQCQGLAVIFSVKVVQPPHSSTWVAPLSLVALLTQCSRLPTTNPTLPYRQVAVRLQDTCPITCEFHCKPGPRSWFRTL